MSRNKLYLDYPLYKYLLPFATTRTQIAGSLLDNHYNRAIDLGCGNGYFLLENKSHFGQASGLDISALAIEEATTRAKKSRLTHIGFQRQDLNLPLRHNLRKYDLVVSLSTIEYLINPHHFLKQVHGHLKPGGQLIIHTMNLAFLTRRLQLLTGRLPTFNSVPGWQGGVLHNFTWPSFKSLLEEHHFQILEERCSGLFPPTRLWAKNLLCSDIIIKARKGR